MVKNEKRAMFANRNNGFELFLPSEREIVLTCFFNAPRRLVFEVHSKPEHLIRWWGSKSALLPICEMDFRRGGSWRYVLREPDGTEYPFKGVYQEIRRPDRLVYTEIFEPLEEEREDSLVTLDFGERKGHTILTSTTLYSSREIRDVVLRSGMESGSAETYDRLAAYLSAILYKI